ncbi:MAG: nucleotidyltransferase family protein [Dehalococcoidia bacterium]
MTLAHPSLTISREELAAFCKRWGIKELSLFGSAARGELRPDSDVDFMVEFDEDAHIGLDFITVMDELARLVGRQVDLTGKEILRNPYRRASIERDLTVLYAA